MAVVTHKRGSLGPITAAVCPGKGVCFLLTLQLALSVSRDEWQADYFYGPS